MPTVYNKVVIDGVTKIDLSQDTVTEAGHILTGHTGHLANGNQVPGTGSGGSNAYTRTEILPVQTFTPDSSQKRATLTGLSEGFVDAGYYIVTYDNAEWIVTCETLWSSNYAIGEAQFFLNTSAFDSTDPFGIIWMSGTTCTIAVGDTNQHTVKIEKLTFDDDPTLLAQKSITANGTYNASSDNADGYSSVTVNVPVGEDIPVFNVVWDLNYEQVTSVSCNKSYAECVALTDTTSYAVYYESNPEDSPVGMSVILNRTYSSYIVYTVIGDSAKPVVDIQYNSDGTIVVTQPSSASLTLNATANGTYTPTNGVYTAVNVNVPSGSPNLQAKTNIAPSTSSQTITADSGFDGLSSVQINAMPSGAAGTPTATKGTVSNHSVTVTPSVTNTTGYITGSTKTGTAVAVSASELVSGSETKTENGTYDVTNLASLVVNVASSSGKNAQISNTPGRATSSTYTAVGPSITVTKTGTYDVYWFGYRSSTSGTNGSQLYIGSTAYGSAQTTFNTGSGLTNTQTVHLSNVSLTANQVLTIRARSRGNNYYMYILGLAIIEV